MARLFLLAISSVLCSWLFAEFAFAKRVITPLWKENSAENGDKIVTFFFGNDILDEHRGSIYHLTCSLGPTAFGPIAHDLSILGDNGINEEKVTVIVKLMSSNSEALLESKLKYPNVNKWYCYLGY